MKKTTISRRNLIRAGAFSVAAAGTAQAAGKKEPTPDHEEGPFYPIAPQTEKDADLTRFGNSGGQAEGEIIVIEGHVYGDDGAPLADAVIDVWQANAHGRYAHEADPNPAPLDSNFQGWAVVKTDANGQYRLKTVLPGAYPAADDWVRPPHIHFKIARRGFREITTQMYFDGQPLNDADLLLNALPASKQFALIAKSETLEGDADTSTLYRFDVALAKV